MTSDPISPETYVGGKGAELRTIIRFGASEKYVVWARTATRLPFGGFTDTRCTTRNSFARWAKERCK